MLSVFRAPDGQVTVVDGEIGTVIAPSEIEARREVERLRALRDQNRQPDQSPVLAGATR